MPLKRSPPLLPSALVVPKHYIQVDMSRAIKETFGACGLPTPETCGIDSDAMKLAQYTELFQKAEALHVPPLLGRRLPAPTIESEEAVLATLKGWELLNGPL